MSGTGPPGLVGEHGGHGAGATLGVWAGFGEPSAARTAQAWPGKPTRPLSFLPAGRR